MVTTTQIMGPKWGKGHLLLVALAQGLVFFRSNLLLLPPSLAHPLLSPKCSLSLLASFWTRWCPFYPEILTLAFCHHSKSFALV